MLYLRTKLPQESANVGKYTSHMDPMGKYALGVWRLRGANPSIRTHIRCFQTSVVVNLSLDIQTPGE